MVKELTLVELLINRFAIVSTGWKTINSLMPADPIAISYELEAEEVELT